eukprot:2790740-Prymnesium_polylepis.1
MAFGWPVRYLRCARARRVVDEGALFIALLLARHSDELCLGRTCARFQGGPSARRRLGGVAAGRCAPVPSRRLQHPHLELSFVPRGSLGALPTRAHPKRAAAATLRGCSPADGAPIPAPRSLSST